MIVYAEADETVVPEYDILHLGKDDPTHSETHRYPFAGTDHAVVIHVLSVLHNCVCRCVCRTIVAVMQLIVDTRKLLIEYPVVCVCVCIICRQGQPPGDSGRGEGGS